MTLSPSLDKPSLAHLVHHDVSKIEKDVPSVVTGVNSWNRKGRIKRGEMELLKFCLCYILAQITTCQSNFESNNDEGA